MTEQEKQELLQKIDIDSIVEAVKIASLSVLNVINDVALAVKENIENGNLDEIAKRVVIEKIVDEAEAIIKKIIDEAEKEDDNVSL